MPAGPGKLTQTWRRLRLASAQFSAILRQVRRPWPMLTDLFKLRHSDYIAHTRGQTPVEMQLRPGGSDRFVFYETVLRRDYFDHGNTPRPGDTVIDIGGNIGGFTIVAAQLVGPTGRVIVAEPDPAAFNHLQANVRRNHLTNVTARQVAIGGRPGTITLRCVSQNLYTFAYSPTDIPPPDKPDIHVPVITLDQLFAEEKIERCHLLKIDCEGGEYEILDALSNETAKNINRIVLEGHPAPNRHIDQLETRLKELAYPQIIREYAMFHASRPTGYWLLSPVHSRPNKEPPQ